jgi:hypothetical protein
MEKMVKGEMNEKHYFFEYFFSVHKKKNKNKFKYKKLQKYHTTNPHHICLSQYLLQKGNIKKIYSMFVPLYRFPALPILPVNSNFFTDLPVNLKPGKSSTLVGLGESL